MNARLQDAIEDLEASTAVAAEEMQTVDQQIQRWGFAQDSADAEVDLPSWTIFAWSQPSTAVYRGSVKLRKWCCPAWASKRPCWLWWQCIYKSSNFMRIGKRAYFLPTPLLVVFMLE